MVNDLNVEQLLVQANPVLDPEELRLTASEVDIRCASILERRGAMQTQTPTRSPGAEAPRRWRKPAFAFMISLLVILIAAGGVGLLVGGGDPEVTDEPVVTTQAPAPTTSIPATTTPTTVPVGPISAPSYADVPSFTGTVQYYEHDLALGDPGWQATVAISFAGPMRYEAEVLFEEGSVWLGGQGKVFLGDGALTWLNESEGMPLSVVSSFDHFRHLYYDSDQPYPPWDEMCAENNELIGTEILLGRTVTQVACSTMVEDYTFWVDEESGLVLKMAGPLGIGDFSPSTARDGGFVFTELTFEPVSISDVPDVATAQTGEFPPFHMIRNAPGGLPFGKQEIWYRGPDMLRETVLEAEDEGWIGTFVLVSDGRLAGCSSHPYDSGCYDVPLEDAGNVYPIGRPYDQLPVSLAEASSAEVSQDSVAGRSARHFECEGVSFPNTGVWAATAYPGSYTELWYDAETGLLLKWVDGESSTIGHGANGIEVTLLEVNPAFPVGIFEYEEMDFPDEEPTGIREGDDATLWRGPLIGGGQFDLADYRGAENLQDQGSWVVVFNWAPGYSADSCLESLAVMQRLSEEYGQTDWLTETGGYNIEFVTVSEDDEAESGRFLDRLGITVPSVYCWEEGDPTCTTPEPGVDPTFASPWFLWGNDLPSLTVVTVSGQVDWVYTGPPSEYESELDEFLAMISWSIP